METVSTTMEYRPFLTSPSFQVHERHLENTRSISTSSCHWQAMQAQHGIKDKSVGLEGVKKEYDVEHLDGPNASATFLGQNFWDKSTSYDGDFKMEYMDLDEFLSENGIPVDPSGTQQQGEPSSSPRTPSEAEEEDKDNFTSSGSPQSTDSSSKSPGSAAATIQTEVKAELALATVPGHTFDPRTRAFTEEELKLQPLIKKSKKQFVNDGAKDDRYWARRKKNNIAAKRSRDARRTKENQIALRAAYLEKENLVLWAELEKLQKENKAIKERLSKYEPSV